MGQHRRWPIGMANVRTFTDDLAETLVSDCDSVPGSRYGHDLSVVAAPPRRPDPDGARVAAVASPVARPLPQVRVRFDGQRDGCVFGVW